MSRVALVILNYNGQAFLKQFLPTLIDFSPEAEIIVADNRSTDNSLAVLQEFEQVKTLVLPKNYGYAGGYNKALKEVKAEYYLLVNSDIEVTAGWINPLVEFLDSNQSYAAVQPKILDYNQRNKFEYAGAAGGYVDPLGYPYCRGRIFDHLEIDDAQYDTNADVMWATGACFMIRSQVFHELDGFDASFFAHMEEIDLFWRIKSFGHKAGCIPQSTVYHVGGGTLNKSSHRKTYLNFRNNLRLMMKNMPKSQLWYIIPVRIILDWLAALVFWRNYSFRHFIAVFRAQKDALIALPKDLKQPERSSPTLANHKKTNLLIAYYIRRNRKYTQLNNTK